jgi:hypothetical protein
MPEWFCNCKLVLAGRLQRVLEINDVPVILFGRLREPTATTLTVTKMPKHYCDYCDVFLTHDSTSGMRSFKYLFVLFTNQFSVVRKAHNSGRNHLANVQEYYACE